MTSFSVKGRYAVEQNNPPTKQIIYLTHRLETNKYYESGSEKNLFVMVTIG